MGIWQRLGEIVEGGAVAVGALFLWAGGVIGGIADPETRRQVAFSAAMIALSAKMAKADGIVTSAEVATFRRLFAVPAGEEKHVARLFDIAKGDVAGFDTYAGRVAAFYGDDHEELADVLDGLFIIATADGAVHRHEFSFLEEVGSIFRIEGIDFERIAARHVVPEEGDPYLILGVERPMDMVEIRRRYRKLVTENHPDKLIARGMPPEFIAIANERLAAINGAFERVEQEKRRPTSGQSVREREA
jgi:DnaJ like chaperone protein